MSYEYIITYTKTSQSPADAFKTMPVLKPDNTITQEQIDALNVRYPGTWDYKVVGDQFILMTIFESKEISDARRTDPIIQDLLSRRTTWQKANNVTREDREI